MKFSVIFQRVQRYLNSINPQKLKILWKILSLPKSSIPIIVKCLTFYQRITDPGFPRNCCLSICATRKWRCFPLGTQIQVIRCFTCCDLQLFYGILEYSCAVMFICFTTLNGQTPSTFRRLVLSLTYYRTLSDFPGSISQIFQLPLWAHASVSPGQKMKTWKNSERLSWRLPHCWSERTSSSSISRGFWTARRRRTRRFFWLHQPILFALLTPTKNKGSIYQL